MSALLPPPDREETQPDLDPADYFNRLYASLCPWCHGKGYVDTPVRIYPGHGIEYERLLCPVCGGTGKPKETENV